MNGMQIDNFKISVPGFPDELVVIQESKKGLFFAVDSSYLEQEIDLILSPYNNGPIKLDENDDDLYCTHPDILKNAYSSQNEHPIYKRIRWVELVTLNIMDLGYWEWVSEQCRIKFVINEARMATLNVVESAEL